VGYCVTRNGKAKAKTSFERVFLLFYCGDEISDEVVNETVGETLNGPDLISSHLGELDHRDDGSWWKRDPYFLYRSWRVWKRKKKGMLLIGQSHAHVGLVIPKHAPSPTNNITTGVISEFFFLGLFFSPLLFPCFRCQKFGEI